MSELLPIRARGLTRQELLLSGVLTAAGAAVAGARVTDALAQTGGDDSEILNFTLTLELLEARYYERGLRLITDMPAEVRAVVTELRDHAAEHVRVLGRLIRRLGATPVTEPQFAFGDAFSSSDRFLEVAQQLEELGRLAYHRATKRIVDRGVLGTTAAILQVEARHAAVIRVLREEPFAPDAMDRSRSEGYVVRRIEPFLVP